MSRRICLAFVALFALAVCNRAHGQDAQNNNPADSPTNSTAQSGDDVAKLQVENAALKKEVSDAKRTIATLQAALAQAGIHHRSVTASATEPAPASADNNASVQVVDTSSAAPSTNAAPTGPLRALPLDATNANVTAAAPGINAGPSRSYTVVKGDSLWKIAHKMYPHDTLNGEDKIRDANKDVFNGKFLQPGQVLVIP